VLTAASRSLALAALRLERPLLGLGEHVQHDDAHQELEAVLSSLTCGADQLRLTGVPDAVSDFLV